MIASMKAAVAGLAATLALVSPPATSTPEPPPSDCNVCSDNTGSGGSFHQMQANNSQVNRYQGIPHGWFPALCADMHIACDETNELEAVLENGSAGELSDFLDSKRDLVKYNRERQVIQVFNCTGTQVIAQYSVGKELVAELQ